MRPTARHLGLLERFGFAYKSGFSGLEPNFSYNEGLAMPAYIRQGLGVILSEIQDYHREEDELKKNKQGNA